MQSEDSDSGFYTSGDEGPKPSWRHNLPVHASSAAQPAGTGPTSVQPPAPSVAQPSESSVFQPSIRPEVASAPQPQAPRTPVAKPVAGAKGLGAEELRAEGLIDWGSEGLSASERSNANYETEGSEARAPEIEMPKTGTGYSMRWPPPYHSSACPGRPEPLNDLKEGIIAVMTAHDNKRLLHPASVLNRVVYDSIEANPFAVNRTPAGEGRLNTYYELQSPDDDTLVFESRFESGNLRRAIQIYPSEYDLILRPDINTRGHTQWYYFSVSNVRKGRRYKFNIINMMKPDSVYNQGLKPLIYSEKEFAHSKVGWFRTGSEIAYYANSIKRKCGSYYTLTFSLTFPHDADTCYLAHCYPYTYTDLNRYLQELELKPACANRFRRRTLCQTLAGNSCDLLTITSFTSDPAALKARRGVLITGRVHPGETQASWMMKGFIDFLTGPSLDAKVLRDNFVFKIVPMLNPDGVINGNYRCSLSGQDLNRQWQDPSRTLHPTIFYTKTMLKRFQQDREVVMYCDLHGHSRKKNVFVYGCDSKKQGLTRLKERIFPRMLWKNSETFSFSDCCFKVQRCKESTGRVVVWRECDIVNSYTLEASFAGTNFGPKCGVHMNVKDFENMGHAFCDTMLDFWDPDQSKVEQVHRELSVLYPDTTEGQDGDSSGEDSSSDDEGASARRKKGKGGKQAKGNQRNNKQLAGVMQRAIDSRKAAASAPGGEGQGGKGAGSQIENIKRVPSGAGGAGRGRSAQQAAAQARKGKKEDEDTGREVTRGGKGIRAQPPAEQDSLGICYSKSLMARITEHVHKLAPGSEF